MNTTLTVDKAGRVVLPKPVRDELQLSAGDALELESFGDHIVLKPTRGNVGMRQQDGLWTFRTGAPISAESVDATIRGIREERTQMSLHPGKARPTTRRKTR